MTVGLGIRIKQKAGGQDEPKELGNLSAKRKNMMPALENAAAPVLGLKEFCF